jgi:CheY-like chemotaxis protein
VKEEKTSRPRGATRILVIEDDVETARALENLLRGNGYDVVVTHDGFQAVSRLMAAETHLILLDIMMPVLSGYWFCDVFRNNPATGAIPIVILSALTSREDIRKGLRLGADAYVTKPFSEDNLLRTIRSVLEKKAAKK